MFRHTVLPAALAAAFVAPAASAAGDKELAAIRAQIRQMQESYEARLQALEQRLQDAQAAVAQARSAVALEQAPTPVAAAAPAAPAAVPTAAAAPAAVAAAANAFNPNISLVLAGTYANLSQDPARYRIQGFAPPGGEVGPGQRSFSLGESELTMAANIDPMFSGQLTFALGGDNTVGVEEAYFQTRALGSGFNLKAGRFLSGLGYLNSIHAHAWDFVDAPLAYQAFFGGQYKPDGAQARWLAPTDTFIELGAEVGSGRSFPGNDRNRNGIGASTVFAHVGDDIGDSGSWRAGLSYLHTGSAARGFDDNGAPGALALRSRMLVADAIFKWAPHGDPSRTSLKLQGEYMRRKENGTIGAADVSAPYASNQSGWYLQGVYQFMPYWRAGLRHDRLSSGAPYIGVVPGGVLGTDTFPWLAPYVPSRSSVMVDYSPSEFSRLRLQYAYDKARPGPADHQIFLQYIMSLGTHAAHAF
jgi:hypothetical protein